MQDLALSVAEKAALDCPTAKEAAERRSGDVMALVAAINQMKVGVTNQMRVGVINQMKA